MLHVDAWSGMIPRHDDRIRLESLDTGQYRIKDLEGTDLLVKEARMSGAVGCLVMQEKEVVLTVLLLQQLDLFLESMRTSKHLHPDKPGDSPVHRIGRDSRRIGTVEFVKRNDLRQTRKSTQEHAGGDLFIRQDFPGRSQEGLYQTRRALGGGISGYNRKKLQPFTLGIVVIQVCAELSSTKEHREPMLLAVEQEQLDIREFALETLSEFLAQPDIFFIWWPPCPAVMNNIVAVNRGEIRPRCQVARLHIEIAAERLKNSSSELNLVGLIPPEGKVGRAAPGSDPGSNRKRPAKRRAAGQPVEIRDVGGLQLGTAGCRVRKPPQSIQHQLNHLSTASGNEKFSRF